jgi:hypothetical protein
MEKLTAWEELNGQPYKPSETLELLRIQLQERKAKAMACPPQEAMALLGINLVLCSPSGMTEADRVEWLKAALMTIGDCPKDLLEDACFEARKVCDHPAKIVPFICGHIKDRPAWRWEQVRYIESKIENFDKPKLTVQKPEEEKRDLGPITQEEINSLPLFLRKSWLNLGMITQDQFDASWQPSDADE